MAAERYDVAVVGCGPVGAVAALLLHEAGFSTVVVERDSQPYNLPRAVHYDGEIMRIFQRLGIADRVASQSKVWKRSVYTGVDGNVIQTHQFDTIGPEGWPPHSLFYQPELESTLRQALSERGVELWLGHRLTALVQDGDVVHLTIVGETGEREITTDWMLGCDGSSSTVRDLLNITLDDLQFDEPWLVVDARVKEPNALPEGSVMVCEPARPATLIDGRGDHRRWEFMLLPDDDWSAMTSPKVLEPLLERWIDPADVDIIRAAVYHFHALLAQRWRHGNVFLLGDAAHQTPPFRGQGMCHGLRDAANLVWKLKLVRDGGATQSLLDTYETERRCHVEEIIALVVEAGRDICLLDEEAARARDKRTRELVRSGTAPDSAFRGLAPLRDGLIGGGGGSGSRFPQPTMRARDGRVARLDEFTDDGFVVVIGPDWPRTIDLPVPLLPGPGTTLLDIRDEAGETTAGQESDWIVLIDDEHTVRRWMADLGQMCAVLRPDGYVYATTETPAQLLSVLEQLRADLQGSHLSCHEADVAIEGLYSG